MHDELRGEALRGEHQRERRDDDEAAADAEEAREESDRDADPEIGAELG